MRFDAGSCRQLAVLLMLATFATAICPNISRVAGGDAGQPSAALFAGKFSNDKLTLELSPSAGGYVGTITLGDDKFPAKASVSGEHLTGSFVASGDEFAFTATFTDGRLILVSGGKTHSLARMVANPLARSGIAAAPVGQTGRPAGGAAPAGDSIFDDGQTFGGFTVLGATPKGKTLFIKLPNAQTLESAMTQAADELGKVFDAKPTLGGAFAEAKSRNKGGVTLTAKLKGHDIHGVIFCGVEQNAGSATVIIATADASKDELATLYAAMPAPPIKMQTHKFPDGSGSVDLPDGWTTQNESAAHGIGVQGPAGQVVIFNVLEAMYDPNCRNVRTAQGNYQTQLNIFRMQMQAYQQNVEARKRFPNILALNEPPKPVPPNPDPNVQFPGQDFCRYCDGPEEVLKIWYPMREEKQKRAGPMHVSLDKIIEIVPLPVDPRMPGSKAGVAYIALTDHDGDKAKHVRAVQRIQTGHIIDGEVWQLSFSSMRAPDETFDRDLPVMSAIMNSVKLDMNVIGKETQAETDAALQMGQQMFERLQQNNRDFQDEQARRFNNFERQMAAQQQARHDSNSDFIEYIGGVRRVYDTASGKTLDVDLFNSNGITNGLNAAANNPNQYIQIPLRYLR